MVLGFIAASLFVLLLPGPGVLYIIARSVSQGQRAGFVSVLGLSAGALVHVVFATVGLSAVLLASATAFTIVKILGAAYLVYLGVRMIFFKSGPSPGSASLAQPEKKQLRQVFNEGVLISILNPKIAVFFLAYLPQFVTANNGPVSQQIFLLGLLYVCLALVTDSGYAYFASRVGRRVRSVLKRSTITRYGPGTVFIGLGITTAFAERK